VWDGPAAVTVGLKGAAANATPYSTLTMRTAPDYADTRNPPATTQDFDVVLTDTAGRKASVAAAPYARGALVPSRGSAQREMVLGGIRIPMSAFLRVDLAHLASIRLEFGGRTARGSIDLADIAWQEPAASGRPRPRG
jgi:hypothetical protein